MIKIYSIGIISQLVLCLFPKTLLAYPEMVRHGYVNCTSCHVSPTGGGVLTQYGRELSREILSAAGKEGESDFAYGAVKPPEWLSLGGDLRTLILYRDSPTVREGRFILMQADFEAAVAYKKMLVAGTAGYREAATPMSPKDYFISRRHYVNYRPTDEISVRAGKFQPAFGINTPDHAIPTKRDLGWDQSSETYNMEAAWIGERLNTYATAIFGRPDAKELKRETGVALNSSISFLDHYKTGVSYFYGVGDLAKRHVAGPFGILGFTPRFFLLTELDVQSASVTVNGIHSTQQGFVNYQRLDYEFIQGFHGFLLQEFSKLDWSKPNSKTYGLGMQYFPRPHFELSLTYQMVTLSGSSEFTDLLFFLFHFYP